ncbi:hypothetical protein D3C74_376010 [compost metagenome]
MKCIIEQINNDLLNAESIPHGKEVDWRGVQLNLWHFILIRNLPLIDDLTNQQLQIRPFLANRNTSCCHGVIIQQICDHTLHAFRFLQSDIQKFFSFLWTHNIVTYCHYEPLDGSYRCLEFMTYPCQRKCTPFFKLLETSGHIAK